MNYKSLLQVINQSDTYDLTVLETLKQELKITDNSQDEILATRIHRASDDINRYCNRIFAKETVKETFRNGWNWKKSLFLRRTPINSITSIIIGSSPNTDIVDSNLYEFDPNDGIGGFVWPLETNGQRVLFPCSWSNWSDWNSIMEITYIGGYTLLDELPYGVEEACIELAKIRYNLASGTGITTDKTRTEIPGVWLKQVDTTSNDSNSFIPDVVKQMLAPFKKTAFPN
jgi:hypothetical protein